jgi:zinc D-Ala-D-Ala dipeptidase
VVSKALGDGLSRVQKALDAQGFTLVVYDAYRPHKAVEGYLEWMREEEMDTQQLYFPLIKAKEDLLTEDYLSSQCPH